MAINIGSALSQYNAAAKRAIDVSPVENNKPARVTPAGETFADLIKDVVEDAVVANKESEKVSMKAITGNADMREVAIAVANAEVSLQTVLTVRDKVVSAYQQIVKMPV